MADTKTLIGGRLGFFEFDLEETASSGGKFIKQEAGEFLSSTFELVKNVAGIESSGKFPSRGSMEFNKPNPDAEKKAKEREIAANQRLFFGNLTEARRNVERSSREEVMETLARMEVSAMPAEQKNKELGLNYNYDEIHINNPYHIKLLRDKKIEQMKEALRQKQSQEMAAATKSASLVGRLDAQEGQSAVSSSGAIFSAG